jgi:hypothetical protein
MRGAFVPYRTCDVCQLCCASPRTRAEKLLIVTMEPDALVASGRNPWLFGCGNTLQKRNHNPSTSFLTSLSRKPDTRADASEVPRLEAPADGRGRRRFCRPDRFLRRPADRGSGSQRKLPEKAHRAARPPRSSRLPLRSASSALMRLVRSVQRAERAAPVQSCDERLRESVTNGASARGRAAASGRAECNRWLWAAGSLVATVL